MQKEHASAIGMGTGSVGRFFRSIQGKFPQINARMGAAILLWILVVVGERIGERKDGFKWAKAGVQIGKCALCANSSSRQCLWEISKELLIIDQGIATDILVVLSIFEVILRFKCWRREWRRICYHENGDG